MTESGDDIRAEESALWRRFRALERKSGLKVRDLGDPLTLAAYAEGRLGTKAAEAVEGFLAAKAFEHFAKMGATKERVLAALGREDIESVLLEDMEKLIGFVSAIKDGQTTVYEAFPEVAKTADAPTPAELP